MCLKLQTLQSELSWAPGHIPATLPLETSRNEMEISLTVLEIESNKHQLMSPSVVADAPSQTKCQLTAASPEVSSDSFLTSDG